jgi:uncharacterized protein with ParB-like and HNH nuclease domain
METTTIRKLFSDQDRRFRIPDYQRAYSWERENILQFIQDLKDSTQTYYLGHFLFEQDKDAPNDLRVIDGQQRLTTCIIFFSSLYQEFLKRKASGEKTTIYIDDIRHIYLRDVRKNTQKLTTVRDDNNYFSDEIVDRKPGIHDLTTRSQERIRDARKLFDETFQDASISELDCWHDLVEKAECTEFHVPDKIKAAQIFAFQNDRGRDLSKLEVLKSYFMLQLYLQKQSNETLTEDLHYVEENVSIIYKQMVKVMSNEDDILLYYWRASSSNSKGFNSDIRNVVKEVKNHIKTIPKNEICGWIKTFIAELARAFRLVEEVEKKDSPNFTNLRYLNNMALAYPFLIRAKLHEATSAQLERLAKLLENVTFRSLLRGGRADIQSRLNGYLTRIADANYVEAVVMGITNDLRNNVWGYWSDKEMAQYLAGSMYCNRVDNYLLWRYEMYLCTKTDYKTPIKIRYEELITQESIEHIAPKTPPKGELVASGYGIYEDKEKPDNGIDSGLWLNRLGNLMLLSQSQNSSYGNKPFKHKLDSYGKDNLLNQQKQVAEFVEDLSNPIWDKSAIEKRQQAILKATKEIWSLDNI